MTVVKANGLSDPSFAQPWSPVPHSATLGAARPLEKERFREIPILEIENKVEGGRAVG